MYDKAQGVLKREIEPDHLGEVLGKLGRCSELWSFNLISNGHSNTNYLRTETQKLGTR